MWRQYLRDRLDVELERTLVVNRLSEVRHVHAQVNTSFLCSVCQQSVGIFSMGQNVLRQHKRVRIVCNRCTKTSLNSAKPRGK